MSQPTKEHQTIKSKIQENNKERKDGWMDSYVIETRSNRIYRS